MGHAWWIGRSFGDFESWLWVFGYTGEWSRGYKTQAEENALNDPRTIKQEVQGRMEDRLVLAPGLLVEDYWINDVHHKDEGTGKRYKSSTTWSWFYSKV